MLGLGLLKRLANACKLQYGYPAFPSHLHKPTLLQAHDLERVILYIGYIVKLKMSQFGTKSGRLVKIGTIMRPE